MSIVISLCDLTGAMVEPWVEAGYEAMLVDPQHVVTREEGPVLKFAGTVRDALPTIGELIRSGRVAAVFGFPPCTDLASSGARWWSAKRTADYMFQAKAASVAEQCRTVGELSGAPWMVENPKGALARVFGKTGKHLIEPYWFTAWEPADNYHQGDVPLGRRRLPSPAQADGPDLGRTRRPDPQGATRTRSRELPQRHTPRVRSGRVRGQRSHYSGGGVVTKSGSCTPGGPLTVSHIPLPTPRPTGTDALTLHNQRPQRVVTATPTGTTAVIRAWAIANEFAVASKGSIPSRVRNAYEQEARRA